MRVPIQEYYDAPSKAPQPTPHPTNQRVRTMRWRAIKQGLHDALPATEMRAHRHRLGGERQVRHRPIDHWRLCHASCSLDWPLLHGVGVRSWSLRWPLRWVGACSWSLPHHWVGVCSWPLRSWPLLLLLHPVSQRNQLLNGCLMQTFIYNAFFKFNHQA